MSETENGTTVPLEPKKREGSRLDRGFPMGKILLIILGFVFFFQIISAWKIINLEKEKTVFESEKQSYKSITEKIPELKREIGDLMAEQQELLSKRNDSKKMLAEIKNALDRSVQKSNVLKSDMELENKRLEDTRDLLQQAETARVQASKERHELSNETSKLRSRMKELQAEESVLNDSIRELREKKLEYDKKIYSLIEREVRINTRVDEFQKLRDSNTELSKIISKLKTMSFDAKSAVNKLDSASGNVVKSDQEFSVAKNKLNEAINNLNSQISKHDEMTTGYSTKIGVATNSLEGNVKQLSIETDALDGFAKRADDELKNLLNNVRLDTGNSVQRLDVATSKIENDSDNFNKKVLILDGSNMRLNSLLDNITSIYRELDKTKQKQIGLVGNLQDLSDVTKQTLDQLRNDLGTAIESVMGFKSNIQKIEKKIESLDIDMQKLNNKEVE